MTKFIAAIVLSLSVLPVAVYGGIPSFDSDDHERGDHHFRAPEIDPSSGISALTLLLGGLTVMRARNAKK